MGGDYIMRVEPSCWNRWCYKSDSLEAQTVKNLPAMQETQVQSLGQEDPLEKGMATHSSILAWKTPWTEEPEGLLSPWGCKESDMTEQLTQEDDETRAHSFHHVKMQPESGCLQTRK